MIMMALWIPGTLWPKISGIHLTVETLGKPKPENVTQPGIEYVSAEWETMTLPLGHNCGLVRYFLPKKILQIVDIRRVGAARQVTLREEPVT